jgi:hypothetical protein
MCQNVHLVMGQDAHLVMGQNAYLMISGIGQTIKRQTLSPGIFEQTLNTSLAIVTYRTYAHSFYTRLLVSEVTVARQAGVSGPITVTRASLTGDDSTDFTWQAEVDYNTTFK